MEKNLQDFSLISSQIKKYQLDYELESEIIAFYYFTLNSLFKLQKDEIEDTITDTDYLTSIGEISGNDNGIDALYINTASTPPNIHLLNYKFITDFKKADSHFPSTELHKIKSFINSILQEDTEIEKNINPTLFSKMVEIWEIYKHQIPIINIHLVSNSFQGLEKTEKEKFEREMSRYTNFKIHYNTIDSFVARLTESKGNPINVKIKAIDFNYFEKSDGDIRALIFSADAKDVIRILIQNEILRSNPDPETYDLIKNFKIEETAFEDNVRIYLTQSSRINKNITLTALSEDNHHFFYFNNGITLTCSKFSYSKAKRSPVIEIEKLQVVNGSQTIHALHEAYNQDSSKFKDIQILCRIYETDNSQLSTNIAEYTNSQNPVESRDIRSNDYTQKKLEQDLLAKGYFYERKTDQYKDKPKNKRIDAEKAGQVLMSFYQGMPAEAKDNKPLIFGEKYNIIFSDEVTGDKLLLALNIFDEIEKNKRNIRKQESNNLGIKKSTEFLLHASYYLLYTISLLSEKYKTEKNLSNFEKIINFYGEAKQIVEEIMLKELVLQKNKYSHRVFFKGQRPKKYLDDILIEN
ncbi:AIPR family protein [Leptospira mtsangambouensis]|uniref:AIPR family protein n=1 Tax=Leptospira mtsangambouensis TaxID=2484912 RepID=UPI001EE9E16A|nr:AIPR family protein [Leptospira mtsangambouensis]MCG6142739.1 AIPR family protein [Leptospira mtsangambouensis]